uniref:Putative Gag-polypeptide of LTR copia-type n=1 Tax=Tanacetum cinerariifolium TaxID=118510 RepID=A0A699HSF1_TANCI|nr:putative Gag-polypeptide of LTR copia-type [Tanacetum cinerariifolium]
MKFDLQVRNNYAFVDGSCLKSTYATSNVLSLLWDRCNAMVLTWIMNYVSHEVYMGLVYSDNCGVVWKELQETYDKVDGYVVYNLLQKINTGKQGGSSAADYYHRLNSLWREFEGLTKLPKCTYEVRCTCDASKELLVHQQIMKLMQFLMGLDECYQLVTRDPLPDVKDAYNIISREEFHKGIPELGHPADQVLATMHNDLKISKTASVPVCEVCHRAKQSRKPFPLSDQKSKNLGELVHLDLWGPYKVTSREGYKYFLTIVDDFSRAVWVYLIKSKDETFDVFMSFINLIQNQFQIKIKVVRLPSSVLNGRFPYELVYNKKPSFSHLRSFGCLCFATILNNHDKLSYKSEKYVLIGYSTAKKAYKLLSLDTRNMFFSRDVKFYETVFLFKMKTSNSKNLDSDSESDHLSFFDNIRPQSPNDKGRTSSFEDSSSPLPRHRITDTSNMYQEEVSATHFDDQSSSEGNTTNFDLLLTQTDNVFDQDNVV